MILWILKIKISTAADFNGFNDLNFGILCFIYCALLSFVKFQVKPINFDDMSKCSALILDF